MIYVCTLSDMIYICALSDMILDACTVGGGRVGCQKRGERGSEVSTKSRVVRVVEEVRVDGVARESRGSREVGVAAESGVVREKREVGAGGGDAEKIREVQRVKSELSCGRRLNLFWNRRFKVKSNFQKTDSSTTLGSNSSPTFSSPRTSSAYVGDRSKTVEFESLI
jgi:hypothetical protein